MIERELGGGGMSRVFLAEETALGRKVVIKVLPAELAAEVNVERFRREIQVVAKLQHPYIVAVHSTGITDGIPYYTMPFVEGESLRARLEKSGQFPVSEAMAVMRDVLEALAYAHECGVVHRDIKPENVLLASNHAHVADFGVAKALSASATEQSRLTSRGIALGTPAYMAPEQATADPNADHRADLYAVGAIAYEMLTGQQVFSARSSQAMLAAHAVQVPEPVLWRRQNTPQPLSDLVMRLLEKEPADRPQTADEALDELSRVPMQGGATAATARRPKSGRMTASDSRRTLRIGTAAAVVVLVAVGGYLITQRSMARDPSVGAQSPSIAVLAFTNMSGDPKNDYLGDGLSEELIGGLSKMSGLQVAARSSSFAFKGKNENVRSIGAILGVGNVLNGSVRRSGSKLRVAVQLTNVTTGYNLWSETYDREMRDVIAVEDEISRAIIGALAVRLRGTQANGQIVERGTTDPEAYDLYLKGRYAWNQRGTHLPEAEQFFRRAIARDSGFALAWSGLAETYGALASWGYLTLRQAALDAQRYAEKGVSLAPELAETHESLGYARCQLARRYEDGLTEFRRAIELDPSLGAAHYFYSLCLSFAGRPRDGLTEGLEAQRLEPLNAQFSFAPAHAYIQLGQPDSAIAVAARATRIAPALASPYATMVFAYAAKSDTAKVRWAAEEARERRRESNQENRLAMNAFLAVLRGDLSSYAKLRRQLMNDAELSAVNMAVAYSLNRNADSTLVWLDRAYARDVNGGGIAQFPLFSWLRADPRFVAFRKKYGIPDVSR